MVVLKYNNDRKIVLGVDSKVKNEKWKVEFRMFRKCANLKMCRLVLFLADNRR